MARPFLAAVGLVFVAHSYAWAQNPVQIATKSELPGQWKKFEGSSVALVTYIGSGSFYTRLRQQLVRVAGAVCAAELRPRHALQAGAARPHHPRGGADGARQRRTAGASIPTIRGSGWRPTTCTRSSGRRSGSAAPSAPIWPLSYESRYRHDVVTVGGGPNVNREFEFGQVNDEARKWTLKVSYGLLFSKDFQTSNFRGSGPGDTTGCLAPASPAAQRCDQRRSQRVVGRSSAAGRPTPTTRSPTRSRSVLVARQGVALGVPRDLQRLQVLVPGRCRDAGQRGGDGPLGLDLGHHRGQLQAAPPPVGRGSESRASSPPSIHATGTRASRSGTSRGPTPTTTARSS